MYLFLYLAAYPSILIPFTYRVSLTAVFFFATLYSWEQWILRIVVNNTPRPISNDSASVIERQRIQDTAEGMLRSALVKVFETTGGSIDHVPPVMYEFEISCSKRADDRENVYSRVTNMPPILNLTS